METTRPLKLKEVDAAYFLCISALWLFFLSDACNKLLVYFQYDFTRISIIIRSLYELLFLSIIIFFFNEIRMYFVKLFAATLILFISGQVLFSFNVYYHYNFIENITIFNKYFFIFIIYFAIYKLQDHPEKFRRISNALELVFIINALAALAGFAFQIDFLRTYVDQSYRYGYSGFIPVQNESTVFFLLGLSHFYYKHFLLRIRSFKFYIMLLSSLVLGTKGIYIFLAMLLVFHFMYHSKIKTKLIALSVIIALYFLISWFLKTGYSQKLLEYFISKSHEVGWFQMIISGRDSYISTRGAEVLDNWTILNFFIGGQDQKRQLIEMDFFDLFFFLGIIGCIIFFGLYFTSIFKFNILKPFNLFFVSSFLILAFFGGHFFGSAINALYVCLVSMYFYVTQRNNLVAP